MGRIEGREDLTKGNEVNEGIRIFIWRLCFVFKIVVVTMYRSTKGVT